ncbi:MAG TPA: metallophosphoesterase family protein [Terriglobales bacterium]
MPASSEIRIGVISDTHGLLRPEAVNALRGSDFILHAGDVGDPAILPQLEKIAPLTAIRGNIDTGLWAVRLPETAVVKIAGISIFMVHDVKQLAISPDREGHGAVVYGHSHQPLSELRNGVLFFNAGSAGPRRFRLPISVGKITIQEGQIRGEIVLLTI